MCASSLNLLYFFRVNIQMSVTGRGLTLEHSYVFPLIQHRVNYKDEKLMLRLKRCLCVRFVVRSVVPVSDSGGGQETLESSRELPWVLELASCPLRGTSPPPSPLPRERERCLNHPRMVVT